jgi:hypothetical protein
MQDTPLVCTLTAADYRDRERAWLKLRPFVTASEVMAGGLRFTFGPAIGLRDSLTELVRLEAECCAWMTFAMAESPDGVQLSITSNSADGVRGVREAFAPLARP